MESKISLHWLLIFSIAGAVFFSIVLLFLKRDLDKSNVPLSVPVLTKNVSSPELVKVSSTGIVPLVLPRKETSSEIPTGLKIPRIGVDAPIVSVGITESGVMDAPVGPRNVGWFMLGPRPGDIGSAVIAGHYGRWKNGEGSVFDKLNTLHAGDRISVEYGKNTEVTFIVRESRTFDPNADSEDVFTSDDALAHLNLITCEGIWDADGKTYSNRLVVFADEEIK